MGTYVILWIVEDSGGSVNDGEAFFEFPLLSAIAAGIIWGLVKMVYWVIDGFQQPEEEEKDSPGLKKREVEGVGKNLNVKKDKSLLDADDWDAKFF